VEYFHHKRALTLQRLTSEISYNATEMMTITEQLKMLLMYMHLRR